MAQQTIAGTPFEIQKLAQRISEAKQLRAGAQAAERVADELFAFFCQAHGVTAVNVQCVRVGDAGVTIEIPDKKPAKAKK